MPFVLACCVGSRLARGVCLNESETKGEFMGLIIVLVLVVLVIMATTLRKDEREAEASQPREEALYMPPVQPISFNQWARLNGVQQNPSMSDYQ